MSEAMGAVLANDPLMVAWTAYKATPAYANTKKWAASPQDVDGSLWAAFAQGWTERNNVLGTGRSGEGSTPRTDARVITSETDERLAGELVDADFARQLERANIGLAADVMRLGIELDAHTMPIPDQPDAQTPPRALATAIAAYERNTRPVANSE